MSLSSGTFHSLKLAFSPCLVLADALEHRSDFRFVCILANCSLYDLGDKCLHALGAGRDTSHLEDPIKLFG